MEESKLNRTRTHRNALPERGSTRQAVGDPGRKGHFSLYVLSMPNAGERQLYCPGVETRGTPLPLKKGLGLSQ